MDLQDAVAVYNEFVPILEATEEPTQRADPARAVVAMEAVLDALGEETPSDQALDDAVQSAASGDVPLGSVEDEQAFEAFLYQEERLFVQAQLNDRASRYLRRLVKDERVSVARDRQSPIRALPRRRDLNRLRAYAQRNFSPALRRVALVGGGCILIAVDVTLDPEPVSKTLSAVFGGVLVDRGFPELRHKDRILDDDAIRASSDTEWVSFRVPPTARRQRGRIARPCVRSG